MDIDLDIETNIDMEMGMGDINKEKYMDMETGNE